MLASVSPGYGFIQVEGEIDALTVEARNAPLGEVLAELGAKLGLSIRTANTVDVVVSGTYKGPLRRVIGRILADRSWFARYSKEAVEIIVVGLGNPIKPP